MNTKINNFKIQKLEDTKFVHPVKITFEQDGVEKSWEAVKSFDSVAILLYHEQKNAFLLVKQFRPPVYLNDKTKGFTYELCAGIVDKDKSLIQIAKEEIDEECGYDVPLEKIEKITSFYTNVGISGGKQNLFFATIDESMKVHNGGGIHDEQIELLFINVDDFKDFIYDESKAKTPGLMFSFYWFLENKNNFDFNK
ncbi:NUDIX hydrolase [Malaciobacter molluscorum LMG 25693]|uniref:NUDIX hydrolase n=1 Tax=Malaciobacter molluscorum LMG 25693 TaxID=870501 RepID=A0A2G1DJN6_9BACT|nr:NUDIX hydrolase [Malaciobacter molluscorum]AXX92855.1 Nudix-type nucleoside diphosphatase, YffH/AdpP family [Malaciobacter molluscorum LMG 25693]PHO18691.1 NUDIX hydrolase [Malaciobacter molluscorum LMG 25693]